MKKILYLMMFMLASLLMNAQDARQRTNTTIVQDVLAQMPVQTQDDFVREFSDLAQTGEEGFVMLSGMLAPQEKGLNSKVEYALSGLVAFVTSTGDESLMKSMRSGLLKSLDVCCDDNARAFVLSQLKLCAAKEDIAGILGYIQNPVLSPYVLAVIINTPDTEDIILDLVKKDATDRLALANAVREKSVAGAEPYLLSWLSDSESSNSVIYAALAECGGRQSMKLLKKSSPYDYAVMLDRLVESGDKSVVSEAGALLKSKDSNIRTAAMSVIIKAEGYDAGKYVISALKSGDRQYRNAVLKMASSFADDAFYARVASGFDKYSDDTKADVINWFGNAGAVSQTALVCKAVNYGGEVTAAALTAAVKLGGEQALAALVEALSGEYGGLAYTALLSFDGDLSSSLAGLLKSGQDRVRVRALELASARRVKALAPQVFELVNSDNEEVANAALAALSGVVSASDAGKLAGMLEKSGNDAAVSRLQNALKSSLSELPSEEVLSRALSMMESSSKPYLYYPAVAFADTEEAVKVLLAAYENGEYSQAALAQLMTMSNPALVDSLLGIAKKISSDEIMSRCAKVISDSQESQAWKCMKYTEILDNTEDAAVASDVLMKMSTLPISEGFEVAARYLADPETAYPASFAVKNIASKSLGQIDYNVLKPALEKAMDVFRAAGGPDDGYAVDEIRKMLAEIRPVEPFVLPDEEKLQGFEMLFDGTGLDKWTGDTVGYKVVNGAIAVSANYGAAGNLYTKEEYRDFVFRFEFCFDRPGVNNGVGIRTPMGVDAAYHGMCEIQILDHDDPIYKDLAPYQVHGSVYGIIPAERIVHKPVGEWSTEEIRVEGDNIKVTVNGKVILEGNIREACKGHNVAPDGSTYNPYTTDKRNHPGMFNEKGHIGFLGHGPGIRLRNVRILNLDK